MAENKLFKLILIEEIKRFSEFPRKTIKEFYGNLDIEELLLQFLCVDATLSRGSLPLAEKYMIKNGYSDVKDRKDKLNSISDYDFYFTSEKIYNFLMEKVEEENLKGEDVIIKLPEIIKNL